MPDGMSWAQRRKRYEGKTPPPGIPHGPNTWARRAYQCDCADCVNPERKTPMTHAERQRKLREAKRGKPVPPGTKHGIYAARVYRCQCDVCSAAESLRVHKQKNPWMYRPTRGRWREENGVTTLCWPPAYAGADWKCDCEVA